MLLNLRNSDNKLVVKDMLDIDFDMCVESRAGKYYVAINRQYVLDKVFNKEKEAENEMLAIAQSRNQLEMELRDY